MTLKLAQSIGIIDVGHGNSTVLIDDDGVVVIDAGPKSGLLEYLREQNITHVDILLISHADQDHLGAVAQLLASNEFTLGRVALNSDGEKASQAWDDMLYELDQAALRKKVQLDISLVPDETAKFDKGRVHVEVLGPSRYLAGKGPGGSDRDGRKITSNSISAVIGLSVDGNRLLLLPGDIDEVGIDDLLAHEEMLKSPMLVFPHHGGKPGSADIERYVEKLCGAVEPDIVVFSIGRGAYETPSCRIVEEIQKKRPSARIMCTQLSEHCSEVVPEADRGYLNDVYCDGRECGICCAGTVLIKLDGTCDVLPHEDVHQAFIKGAIKQPLCMKGKP